MQGGKLGRILLEYGLVDLDRLIGLPYLVLVQARKLEANLQLLRFGFRQLQFLVVDGKQLCKPTRGDIQTLQSADRFFVFGLDLQDRLVAFDRGFRIG